MDHPLVEQLRQLERGSRGARSTADFLPTKAVNDFSLYNTQAPDHFRIDSQGHHPRHRRISDFVVSPMVMESLDERMLRYPDRNIVQDRTVSNQPYSSVPGSSTAPTAFHDAYYQPRMQSTQHSSFFEPSYQPAYSSSPHFNPQSSPTFRASQRQWDARELEESYLTPRTQRGGHDADIAWYHSIEPSVHDMNNPTIWHRHTKPRTDVQVQPVRNQIVNEMSDPTVWHRQNFPSTGLQVQPARPPIVHDASSSAINHHHNELSKDLQAQPARVAPTSTLDTPIVQGIRLVSTRQLPDNFRSIFQFPLFNAVQSKSFETIYNTNDNFVLSAPTGSGKTGVLELAICRLMQSFAQNSFKIVYQAPTRSLCSERQRDWTAKFEPLGLKCTELTGDTGFAQMRDVRLASIIITTPEKWDGITRKWKDHQKLMQMVKLFLIDEVHVLKEERGATLEAVVSRMKSVGSDVRFVALSATVPNSQDIAAWLGKDSTHHEVPARRERFGEEFRPVKVQKHVCGYQSKSNEFAFEKTLNAKLPDIITKWSQKKPIMVFCFTRKSCEETAKILSNWWATKGTRERCWEAPRKHIVVEGKDLREIVFSGVAFHHAGLSPQDRSSVEKGYIEGDLNVICCTSTLAVGVNLPCHMVIIKNTVAYQNPALGGCKEYSDLEIMQMLGRAGRPQYDQIAMCIVMTRLQRVLYYEKMISGQEILESCLHRNLIDHINAEIGLGTITDELSAKKWLKSTFLYIRLKDRPDHYQLDGDAPSRNIDDQLERYCSKAIALLEKYNLVQTSPKFQCTEFGDVMSRYCVQFETMQHFLNLPANAKVSEILSFISQAGEFKNTRFRPGEKGLYKNLNQNPSIKFPINVNLDLPAHKISLIIQSTLGAIDYPVEDNKHQAEYNNCKSTIFQHVTRLIRCIVDCQLYRADSVSARNALMLARSLGSGVWDDSPLHLKQLDGIGVASVRKLVSNNIRSFEDLESAEPHQIDHALSRNPPTGMRLQEKAKKFPRLWVSLKLKEPIVKKETCVTINITAEIGFLNDEVPLMFQSKHVYVCFLGDTSDGRVAHFARTSAKKLNKGQDLFFSADLTCIAQNVRAYVMCDEIAGTMKYATLKPELSPDAYAHLKRIEDQGTNRRSDDRTTTTSLSLNKIAQRSETQHNELDDFDDVEIDDADLAIAEAEGFVDLEKFCESGDEKATRTVNKLSESANTRKQAKQPAPQQLENGKWACNHPCKNKTACKHPCCKKGLEKMPKARKVKDFKKNEGTLDPKQTQLDISVAKISERSKPTKTSSRETPYFRRVNSSKEGRDLNQSNGHVNPAFSNGASFGNIQILQRAVSDPRKTDLPGSTFVEAARKAEDDSTSAGDSQDVITRTNDLNDDFRSTNGSRLAPLSPSEDSVGIDALDEEMLDIPSVAIDLTDDSKPYGEECSIEQFQPLRSLVNSSVKRTAKPLDLDQIADTWFTNPELTKSTSEAQNVSPSYETGQFAVQSGDKPLSTQLAHYGKRARLHENTHNRDEGSPLSHKRQMTTQPKSPEHHNGFVAESQSNPLTKDPQRNEREKNTLTKDENISATEQWFSETFGTTLFNFLR